MKITAIEVIPVLIPLEVPYGERTSVAAVIARLETDQGIEGLGHAITLSTRDFKSLTVATEELAELLVGEDPRRVEQLHRRLLPDGVGAGGVGNVAAAVLDIGVWDLSAKAAGLPLHRLLGGYRDRIPAYASLRLGRAVPTAELPEIASSLVAQGFGAMKMNLGGQPNIDAEVERVRVVREAIGSNVQLLADVNSRWTPSQAIRIGRLLEAFRLFWIEDPVATQDLDGLTEVRRGVGIPIACAETLYGLAALRLLFERRAVDIPMPDLARIGGITPFLKAAHLAEAFGLPMACHLLPEISAQVLAAVPNGLIVEYVPWA